MSATGPDYGAQAVQALAGLQAQGHPDLARKLAGLFSVIASEATRSPRLREALSTALCDPAAGNVPAAPPPTRARAAGRSTRRTPGPFDPYKVYRAEGPDGLRDKLAPLSAAQLRDIIAEHGMDPARQTSRWREARLAGHVVDMVTARTGKGDAFRD